MKKIFEIGSLFCVFLLFIACGKEELPSELLPYTGVFKCTASTRTFFPDSAQHKQPYLEVRILGGNLFVLNRGNSLNGFPRYSYQLPPVAPGYFGSVINQMDVTGSLLLYREACYIEYIGLDSIVLRNYVKCTPPNPPGYDLTITGHRIKTK